MPDDDDVMIWWSDIWLLCTVLLYQNRNITLSSLSVALRNKHQLFAQVFDQFVLGSWLRVRFTSHRVHQDGTWGSRVQLAEYFMRTFSIALLCCIITPSLVLHSFFNTSIVSSLIRAQSTTWNRIIQKKITRILGILRNITPNTRKIWTEVWKYHVFKWPLKCCDFTFRHCDLDFLKI